MSGVMTVADPLEGTAYRAVRRLVSGEVAAVLLAEHRELGAPCIVELLHGNLAGAPRFVERMACEARVLGRLRHPHVVSVWGAGSTPGGRPFIVTERLKGRTLREELQTRGGSLPAPEAVRYTRQLLSALTAMHDVGVVHRAIQLDNVFVCRELEQDPDEEAFVKLVGFASARMTPDAPDAPQGIRAEAADRHADVHAVARVLYEMLAGSSEGLCDPPEPPLRFAGVSISAELDSLVLQALSQEPSERFQSPREFEHALASVTRLSPAGASAPSSLRHYGSLALVCLASAAATFALALYLGLFR